MGNDPHFFLPLAYGDHMCFSIQGKPNFAFNMIKDQCSNLMVSLFYLQKKTAVPLLIYLHFLEILVRDPETDNTTSIKIAAKECSIQVGSSLISLGRCEWKCNNKS